MVPSAGRGHGLRCDTFDERADRPSAMRSGGAESRPLAGDRLLGHAGKRFGGSPVCSRARTPRGAFHRGKASRIGRFGALATSGGMDFSSRVVVACVDRRIPHRANTRVVPCCDCRYACDWGFFFPVCGQGHEIRINGRLDSPHAARGLGCVSSDTGASVGRKFGNEQTVKRFASIRIDSLLRKFPLKAIRPGFDLGQRSIRTNWYFDNHVVFNTNHWRERYRTATGSARNSACGIDRGLGSVLAQHGAVSML